MVYCKNAKMPPNLGESYASIFGSATLEFGNSVLELTPTNSGALLYSQFHAI